ncbi:hypothetical protein ABZ547_29350 [Streptomyces sparsogenes]|uniref:hypothetical protein n=1 Tax=Streptomyces sparsogenes TaxID=67365 RepID=UPI0033CB22CA
MTVLAVFLLIIGAILILLGTLLPIAGAFVIFMGIALIALAAFLLIRRALRRRQWKGQGRRGVWAFGPGGGRGVPCAEGETGEMGSDHAERVELPLTPGGLDRGFRDEDGGGDRSGGVGGGCGGHGLPNRAGDFQGMVSGGDRELDLDVPAGWIVMVLHLDREASQHGGEAGDTRNTRHDVRRRTDGPPHGTCSGHRGRASRGRGFRRRPHGPRRGPRLHACLRARMEIRDAQVSRHRGQAEPFSGRVEQCAPQLVGGVGQRLPQGCCEGGFHPERARR